MNILYLSRWFPFPPNNGAKIRVFHLIKSLAETHTVDLISFTSELTDSSQILELGTICRKIEQVLYRPFQPGRTKAIWGYFSDRPRSFVDTYQPEMASKIIRAIETNKYNLVIASEIDMIPYAQALKGITRLFEDIEVNFYLDELKSSSSKLIAFRNQATWWKLSSYLRKVTIAHDGYTVVSEQERKNLTKISPLFGSARVIPNGAEIGQKAELNYTPENNVIIYAGSLTYNANFDAVNYFVGEIFPLIQKKHPEVRLQVTGSLEKVDLRGLSSNSGLTLTGYVPDVSSLIARSWISVVPLRKGSGTRLKVLESLSLGTPVISTSKGVEGLDLVPEEHFLVADEPEAFAAQVNRILEDADLRSRLSLMGRQHVQQKYDWKNIGATFREYAEDVSQHRFQRTAVSGF